MLDANEVVVPTIPEPVEIGVDTEPVGIGSDGCLSVGERPGLGIVLDEAAIRRYRVS